MLNIDLNEEKGLQWLHGVIKYFSSKRSFEDVVKTFGTIVEGFSATQKGYQNDKLMPAYKTPGFIAVIDLGSVEENGERKVVGIKFSFAKPDSFPKSAGLEDHFRSVKKYVDDDGRNYVSYQYDSDQNHIMNVVSDENGNAYSIELVFNLKELLSKLKIMETTDTTLTEV